MYLKTLHRGLKKLQRHLARKQKYGIIIKKDEVYDYWFFWLSPDDEKIIRDLLAKDTRVEIIEIRKIPQYFTESRLKRRVNILNRREARDARINKTPKDS